MFVEWIKSGKPTVLGAISGAVAGLVVITPASGFTTPMYAIIMGFIGGAACFFSATFLKHLFGYDDSLDAFGVHGVGGTVGAILTGVFAVKAINPIVGDSGIGHHVLSQFLTTLLTYGMAAVGSLVILQIVRVLTGGLRLSESDEYDGLDLTQHGESGYNFEEAFPATMIEDSGPVFAHSN
jgi:Amt family ammonium transporter